MANGSNPFAVTAASAAVELDEGRRGKAAFVAQNVSGRRVKGRARLLIDDPAQAEWFTIEGEEEQEFDQDQVRQFVVGIAVPADAPEGKLSFRLELNWAEDPQQFGQSGRVSVEVGAAPVPANGNFPWWIIAAVVGGLIVIGGSAWGVTLWARANRDDPSDRDPDRNPPVLAFEVPVVEGLPPFEAEDSLRVFGLQWQYLEVEMRVDFEEDLVIAQSPGSGNVRSGDVVDLTVGVAAVRMPEVRDGSRDSALDTLLALGLPYRSSVVPRSPDIIEPTVVSQIPDEGFVLLRGDTVTLTLEYPERPSFPGGIFLADSLARVLFNSRVPVVERNWRPPVFRFPEPPE